MLRLLLAQGPIRQLVLLLVAIPLFGRIINRLVTNWLASATTPRPRPYSLWSEVPLEPGQLTAGPISDYTSWPSLTNREFSARHLAPESQQQIEALPVDANYNPQTGEWGAITSLFGRKEGQMKEDRSSTLFMFFAQWFTDSILRINGQDRRKNTSNHEIDLCQIYGLNEAESQLLRSHHHGKLRSQSIDGEEYPDYLGERVAGGSWQVKSCYQGLSPHGSTEWIEQALRGSFPKATAAELDARKDKLYATGLERGNSSVGYVALSTLFMREHNRICDQLIEHDPDWVDNDERIFQTARLINTCLLMKFVVEDYINHIAGMHLFRLDHNFAERQPWYRQNWIALEFDLLYRWHGLVPDQLLVDGRAIPANDYRWNNALLEDTGLAAIITSASKQPAGRIGLANNPAFLMGSEYQTIKMGRDFRLQSFNHYRQQFGLRKLKSFKELTSDLELQKRLTELYGNIDQLELVVGLFAEEAPPGALFGELMLTMVAYDAFTQIYTNPLLSVNIHTPETFSQYGIDLIRTTASFEQMVRRNVSDVSTLCVSLGV